jgi:hypothetical protein
MDIGKPKCSTHPPPPKKRKIIECCPEQDVLSGEPKLLLELKTIQGFKRNIK